VKPPAASTIFIQIRVVALLPIHVILVAVKSILRWRSSGWRAEGAPIARVTSRTRHIRPTGAIRGKSLVLCVTVRIEVSKNDLASPDSGNQVQSGHSGPVHGGKRHEAAKDLPDSAGMSEALDVPGKELYSATVQA
jgi:hypothetical protein